MDEPTCSVDDCGRPAANRGWCRAHYERQRKTGDLNASVPVRDRTYRRPVGAQCAIEGCERPREHRDWCGMHYARWKAHGDALHERLKPTACSADGCGKEPYSRGYCMAHYYKLLRHGDAEWQVSLKPGSEVTYRTMHERVQKARGKAAEYQCVRCGAPAVDWAWIHGKDPADADSYTPMCKSCHMKYDLGPERHHERTTPKRVC